MDRGHGPESDSAMYAREELEQLQQPGSPQSDTEVFMAPTIDERNRAIEQLRQGNQEQDAKTLARVEAIKAKLKGIPVKEIQPQEAPNAEPEQEPEEIVDAPEVSEEQVESTPEFVEDGENEKFESWKIAKSKEIASAHDRVIRMTNALDSAKQNQLTNEERLALMRDAGIRGVTAQDFSMYQGDIMRAIGREKNKLRGLLDTYKEALEIGQIPELDAETLDARLERGETSSVRIDFSNAELVKQALAEQSGNEDYPPYRNLRNAINSGRPGRDWQFMGQDSKGNYLFIEANQAVEYDNGEQAKDHAIAISKKLVEEYAKMI